VRLAYATAGHGPPLVMAASWLTHLEYVWESPVWRGWLERMTRSHTLVRHDARGCGLSDRDAALSFDAWVRDLETVVDAAGVERFPLLGMSQGAPVAIAYAVRHPERVTRLVLHGSYARGFLKRDSSPRQRELADSMKNLIELGWGQENPSFRQFFTTQFIPDGTPEQHQWFNELARVSTAPHIAARFFSVITEIDVSALAPRVRCPTLVLHSRHDERVPFEEGRLVASLIPGARFVSLESRNHLLLETEPGYERWFEEVNAFLGDEGGAAPAQAAALDGLTARERELADLIARGLDNAQIAARLELSEKTVRNHITSIFSKLQVETRAQLIVKALGRRL
jgi:pimeloyl-ACP methyl ester carboxylesterase/DNA-binding CsgD family transcriptional regulator